MTKSQQPIAAQSDALAMSRETRDWLKDEIARQNEIIRLLIARLNGQRPPHPTGPNGGRRAQVFKSNINKAMKR